MHVNQTNGILKPKNILVVGGAGYVGSHVRKLLDREGYNTVVLDDLSTGHKKAVQSAVFYEGSCGDPILVESILKKHSIGAVMHFSAKALVGESVENPLLYYSVNVGQTISLLSAMQKCGVKYFIFSSTCATFGEPKETPIHENLAQNPVNPYGSSKLFVEKILSDLSKQDIIHSAVLRYFNAAGSDPEGELGENHNPETHLIPKIIRVALGQEPKLIVNGNDYSTKDGTCIRDYVHVNDLGYAHIKAMNYIIEKNRIADFNLGSEKGYSVLEVIQAVKKVMSKDFKVEFGQRRPGDPAVLVADSRKAKEILNWKTTFSLEQIISHAEGWIKKNP